MSHRFKTINVEGYEVTAEMLEKLNELYHLEYELWPHAELDIETLEFVPFKAREIKREWLDNDRTVMDYGGQ